MTDGHVSNADSAIEMLRRLNSVVQTLYLMFQIVLAMKASTGTGGLANLAGIATRMQNWTFHALSIPHWTLQCASAYQVSSATG